MEGEGLTVALALTLALTLTLTLRGYYDRQSGRAELLARQRRRAPRDVATLAHHVRHTGGCLHRAGRAVACEPGEECLTG